MSKIGIRHEDKYLLERRVALTPSHVEKLIENEGIEVYVQSSAKRVFLDSEYEAIGAHIVNDFPEDVKTIFGVKEFPNHLFKDNSTNIFFSHTIKGQDYNMPMLRQMMEQKVNLIDYEKITDGKKRLIFFGRFAGLAGAINSIWSLGQRLELKGVKTPFSKMNQAYTYTSLEDAIDVVKEISKEISENGLPKEISPVVFGVTGYGNVGRGAIEIIDLLPFKELSASELLEADLNSYKNNEIIKVIFKEEDLSVHKDGLEFNLQHYYSNPEDYINKFEDYMPKISVLMNCMYWDFRYPRIITKDFLHSFYKTSNPKLEVIGDVTCDPDGSIECTHSGTPIVNPVYVYNPITKRYSYGFNGKGVLMMAVDILPSELPRESSKAFGDALLPFIPAIANANFSQKYEDLDLPNEIKSALILLNGELTPDYKYLNKHI